MLNDENLYLFKFAWRSIRRNAGRSFFIGLSVSLAVILAVWVVAFFDGMNLQIEQAVVDTNTGFFQIQEPLYFQSTDSSKPREYDKNITQLLNQIETKSISPELVMDGNIITPEGAAGLLVLGIDPSLHSQFLSLNQHMIDGHYLDQIESNSIMIGQELARIFKFKSGDQLVLNYQDMNGELRSELLTIKGIYQFNSIGYEKRFVYLNQKTWQQLFLNQSSDKILFNRIVLRTNDLSVRDEISKIISKTDLKLKTWKNLNPEMAVVLEFNAGMIRLFFLIIGAAITMSILTPVRMLWQERLKELKMMNIIGVSKSKFWKIGYFEVGLMIILSSIGSIIPLSLIIGIQSYTGIDFSFMNNGVSIERAGIKLPAIIYPDLSIKQIFITFVFVFFVLGISYVWSIKSTLKNLENNS